jgi:hypothetical protein
MHKLQFQKVVNTEYNPFCLPYKMQTQSPQNKHPVYNLLSPSQLPYTNDELNMRLNQLV